MECACAILTETRDCKVPVLFDDLGFFLNQGLNCMYGDNKKEIYKCAKLFLIIVSRLDDDFRTKLTMKYSTMRFDETDIEYVGLVLAKELIEIGIELCESPKYQMFLMKLHIIVLVWIESKLKKDTKKLNNKLVKATL